MSDRPFVRQLIQLAARLTGPAHRQDMWPGLAIDRAAGQVTWRGKPLLTLVPFAAIVQQGLPLIAVVGSGPSLAAQDPAHLPPHRHSAERGRYAGGPHPSACGDGRR